LERLLRASPAPLVVDVREPDERAALRATGTKAQALSELAAGELGQLAETPRRERVYVLCRSGSRSARAALMLRDAGFEDVVNVSGGLLAWEAAGLPLERGG
jgi:rhodanese-related sulfurtransferase